jgi:parvulin-like peptidyl-prolyl isomerase
MTALMAGAAMLGSGCGEHGGARPLTPESFHSRSPLTSETPAQPLDQPGAIVVPQAQPEAGTEPKPFQSDAPPQSIQPVIKEAIKSPDEAATMPLPPDQLLAPTTIPATAPVSTTSTSSGQYMTLGAVVAEVNGTPIYVNKVLSVLVVPLRANAREMEEPQFKIAATNLIRRRIQELIRDELQFAAAVRALDSDDKDLVNRLTVQYRQQLLTDAGGSVELARRKAEADGTTLEDKVQDEYRRLMTQVFFQKRLWPRVQVSAEDMRRYYDRNLSEKYTEHDQAHFLLIKIDPAKMGGVEEARTKAQELHDRAARGEDFASLAGSVNHDARLMKEHGDVGWVQRGAYRLEKVEQAVWSIEPGAITPVIDDGGAFYLARLEQRKKGRVMPFDEEAVQNNIRDTLRMGQFRAMREQVLQGLMEKAIVRGDPDRQPDMMAPAIEIALQEYPRWSRSKD